MLLNAVTESISGLWFCFTVPNLKMGETVTGPVVQYMVKVSSSQALKL